jgi:DUF1680 family protein
MLPPVRKGFVQLSRIFNPGDRITLTLPMRVAITSWPDNGVGVEHGPLVYAFAVQEDWKPVVTPRWSTSEYPEWDSTPISAWNYALALDPAQRDSHAEFERKTMTADPWTVPPVRMTVPAKKVARWTLRADAVHPERMQTPPLPQMDRREAQSLTNADVERVMLVPLGATQLRVTIFPKV